MHLAPANVDVSGAARLDLTQKVKCDSEAAQAASQAAHTASHQPTGPAQLQTISSGQAGGGATSPVQVRVCSLAMFISLLEAPALQCARCQPESSRRQKRFAACAVPA